MIEVNYVKSFAYMSKYDDIYSSNVLCLTDFSTCGFIQTYSQIYSICLMAHIKYNGKALYIIKEL
jgi:hypothetical protein